MTKNRTLNISTIISIISAVAAVASALVAVWQTMEAKSASRDAFKFALASERLESCMTMNSLLSQAIIASGWSDFMDKPYNLNPRFGQVYIAIDLLVKEIDRFKQMTPGEATTNLNDNAFKLWASLGDMVADGSDYLSRNEIDEKIRELRNAQATICKKMIAPDKGF